MKERVKSIWDDLYDHEAQAKLLAQLKLEVHYHNIAKSILIALDNQPNGLTKNELLKRVRARKQRFIEVLKKLRELKKVHRSNIGKKKQPFLYRINPWN